MITRLVDRLIAYGQRRPYTHLDGYMERYFLIAGNYHEGERAMRLHHILRSDNDRHFHDHPWNFASLILRGGYWEIRPVFFDGMYIADDVRWRGPGSIAFRRARDWHRLELPYGQTCWTLFITLKKRQEWGFLTQPNMKTLHQEYLQGGPTQ